MYRKIVKRLLDFILSLILIFILLVPLIIIGIIIKVTSKGPVFFIQQRYGKDSKPFNMYKFRSMTNGAPIKSNSEFSNITNYITPVGMFIRKTSIDELPQLINILKGEMSFIGPRPLAKTDSKVLALRKFNGADRVLPGISGLAQVSGRNNISDEDKAVYDAKYAANICFRLDFVLVMETVVSVIKHEDIFNEKIKNSNKIND